MFTGIIETIGEIEQMHHTDGGVQIVFSAGAINLANLNLGDSIAVNGICLTITVIENNMLQVFASDYTNSCTCMSSYRTGTEINLETAVKANQPLGGHMVSGHVDGTAQCMNIKYFGESTKMTFAIERNIGRYLAEQGSVAIDGVSMTVNSISEGENTTKFEVTLIPHTKQLTTLGSIVVANEVNIEVDLLSRYAERALAYINQRTDS